MKTIGDIRARFYELVKENTPQELTDVGQIYEVLQKSRSALRTELVAYYSTIEGRKEISDSPQYHLTTEQAVDVLMKDVDCWINRELNINAEVTE